MTTNSLDSRALTAFDTFGQRFRKEGTYRYAVTTAGSGGVGRRSNYRIKVGPRAAESGKQHVVLLQYRDRIFKPDQVTLKIAAGDLVTFACRDPRAPAYQIVGDGRFSSVRMRRESGYGHAFGTAGEVEWRDAHGSGAGGRIRVRDPKVTDEAGLAKWREQLTRGVVVEIVGDQVKPAEVEVLVGQTVFFAVTRARGTSITDARILKAERVTARSQAAVVRQ